MPQVAYIDGSCSPNPGRGGWAVVFDFATDSVIELSGGENPSTNNRMELMAAIVAIEKASPDDGLTIYTDSQYVKQGITAWIAGWKRKGWRNSFGEPVKNQDLWQRLDAAVQVRGLIDWKWVKGHSGNPGNDRADQLANAAARGESSYFPPAVLVQAAAAAPRPAPAEPLLDSPDQASFPFEMGSHAFGFDLPTLYVYPLGPIDFNWSMLRTVDEVRAEIELKALAEAEASVKTGSQRDPAADAFDAMARFMEHWANAQSAARARYWEGDFVEAPRVMWVPRPDYVEFAPAFVWKQRNNGMTFVVSPVEMSELWKPWL